jgi:hypothetical protein
VLLALLVALLVALLLLLLLLLQLCVMITLTPTALADQLLSNRAQSTCSYCMNPHTLA